VGLTKKGGNGPKLDFVRGLLEVFHVNTVMANSLEIGDFL